MFPHKNIEGKIMVLNTNGWKSSSGLDVQQPYRIYPMEERLRFNSVAVIPGDTASVKEML